MKKKYTLCVIHQNDHVLLGMKKRGFGKNRWNGFGGKLEEGETLKEAAMRELKEEVGIIPLSLKKRGILLFRGVVKEILEVHVFGITSFEGDPIETEEMRPQWFKTKEIPFENMWPDDKHWFPLLLSGKSFHGRFNFEGDNNLISHALKEVEKI